MSKKSDTIRRITSSIKSIIEHTELSSWKKCNLDSNNWRETSMKCEEVLVQIDSDIKLLDQLVVNEPEINRLRQVLVDLAMKHVYVLSQLNEIRTRYIENTTQE